VRHRSVREALGRHLEGELAPGERRAVERHLAGCAACREEHRELRATVDLLRSLPDPEPPASLVPDLLRRIESAPGPRRARWLGAWVRVPLPVPVAALAAGLAVLAVTSPPGGWLGSPPSPGVEAPRLAAREASPAPGSAQRPQAAVGRVPQPARRAPSAPPPSIPAGAIEPAALDVVRGARAVRRRPPPSGIGAAAAPGVEARAALPPRPSLVRCVTGAGPVSEASGAAEECRPWLHGMVTLAQYDPRGFLAQVESLPETERAAWLPELAFFSQEIRASEAVASALRATPDPRALELIHWFEADPGQRPR
jgi:hypothetical protein